MQGTNSDTFVLLKFNTEKTKYAVKGLTSSSADINFDLVFIKII